MGSPGAIPNGPSPSQSISPIPIRLSVCKLTLQATEDLLVGPGGVPQTSLKHTPCINSL